MCTMRLHAAAQAFPHRTDSKLYRILTPQTPIARTKRYDAFCMDEHPNGTNMIVAVLAYTCTPFKLVVASCCRSTQCEPVLHVEDLSITVFASARQRCLRSIALHWEH